MMNLPHWLLTRVVLVGVLYTLRGFLYSRTANAIKRRIIWCGRSFLWQGCLQQIKQPHALGP